MFGITTLSEYALLSHQFIERKGICLIFVFIGLALLLGFGFSAMFFNEKEQWPIRWFCYFCVLVGLIMEIIAFGYMMKIERNIGALNNEWQTYQEYQNQLKEKEE